MLSSTTICVHSPTAIRFSMPACWTSMTTIATLAVNAIFPAHFRRVRRIAAFAIPTVAKPHFSPLLNEQNEAYMEGESCDTDKPLLAGVASMQWSRPARAASPKPAKPIETSAHASSGYAIPIPAAVSPAEVKPRHNPTGTGCNTDSCLLEQSCQDGLCQGGTPKVCPTSLPCYTGVCNARGEDDLLMRPGPCGRHLLHRTAGR